MGSPIAPVAANIFMEWFEGVALNTAVVKPKHWWRYVDDIFAIITKDSLPEFTRHVNSIHDSITVTVEEESNGMLPFLDLKIVREVDGSLSHTVYRKPTHTDRYLRADSHHHPAQLSSVPRSLINRALKLCDPQFVEEELEHVRDVLEDNGYNWKQCLRWANPRESTRTAVVERSPAYLPYVRGVTDRIGYLLRRRYSIKTVFRSQTQLRRLLRSPKDRDHLNVPGVYKIPCDCGKSYVGETRRNITTRLTEHIRSIKNSDTTRSALAEHAKLSNINHYIRFDKASVLAREKFFIPRKIREAIEINRHPNFNRDQGWTLPSAWLPVLNAASKRNGFGGAEQDTVSYVCSAPPLTDDDETDDDSARSTPPCVPPPLSLRAARAIARSARRDLLS